MSSGNRCQRVSTRIAQRLSSLSHNSNEQCIFRVYDRLRSQNAQEYEPKVLSIGPHHHGKSNLKMMETKKLRYLQMLLRRRGEENADRYIIALTELEDRARRCYAEDISLSEDDFVDMMCLDGCFVIEFLRKLNDPLLRDREDIIFHGGWLLNSILRDIILFENQVPFFILVQLFDMTTSPDREENLIDLALRLCRHLMSDYDSTVSYNSISAREVIHLLGLVHGGYCSSFAATLNEINVPIDDFSLEFIKSTTELRQSGIKFEKAMQNDSWFHISYKDGKLNIPPLTVDDHSESVFRNLIAYEVYTCNDRSRRIVSDYAMFLDRLIDSPGDVEELRHLKIIRNWLGDDEAVCTMFNKLGNHVQVNRSLFCYRRIFMDVNDYSHRRRNKWVAQFKRNYFNSPWSIISFLAAVVLLFLTFVQTIFSILSYIKQ